MEAGQESNSISVIHRLVTDEYGENYWFNGCAGYVMECLGEKDYDYWFFAGVTGDLFTQQYCTKTYSGDALSSFEMDRAPKQFVRDTFAKCGYEAVFVSGQELEQNAEMYLQELVTYLDRGIPVIAWGQLTGVYVGYEEYGRKLLYISGNSDQPGRLTLEEALQKTVCWSRDAGGQGGWVFVGDKKESPSLAGIYRNAIADIPRHFAVRTDLFCFGAQAFRAWAEDLENGRFDGVTAEEFDLWGDYTNYVCVLATNGSCSHRFLERARELNPDMGWLEMVENLYGRTGRMWNDDNGKDLEAMGGGFRVTLETLQDKKKRAEIAEVIRTCGACMEEVLRILNSCLSVSQVDLKS